MVAVVSGLPVIVGALFAEADTTMLKAGRAALRDPSLTLMRMLEVVPAAVGVPVRRPVVTLNCAHVGLFWMLQVSVVLLSRSEAVGANVYAAPMEAVVAGVPAIDGAPFGAGVTRIANAASVAVDLPSLTLMRMFETVVVCVR